MKSAYPKSEGVEMCLSPGFPYLLANTISDSLQRRTHTLGAHEKDEPSTAAYFLTIKALQKEEKESADAGELSS